MEKEPHFINIFVIDSKCVPLHSVYYATLKGHTISSLASVLTKVSYLSMLFILVLDSTAGSSRMNNMQK